MDKSSHLQVKQFCNDPKNNTIFKGSNLREGAMLGLQKLRISLKAGVAELLATALFVYIGCGEGGFIKFRIFNFS